jgi:uncharacterized protein (DUF488 family)
MGHRLCTIGYEASSQPDVLAALQAAGVELLVDVRAIAASRRAGFAKRQLAAGLVTVGIDYLHLRALGTPKEGRIAVRAGQPERMRPIFEAHLATPEAQAALQGLASLVAERRVCLLCLERDPATCHRTIIAEHLARQAAIEVEHLTPAPRL